MTNTARAIDLFFDLLHAAGWSIGDVYTTEGWLVTGTNGDSSLVARGATQAEAWAEAVRQAAVLGLIRPLAGGQFL